MLDTLKRIALAAIDSRHEDKERELLQFRAAAQQNGTAQQPRTWRRILNANANLVGFEFCCACNVVYTLLDLNLLLAEDHRCPCGHRFGLLSDLGLQKTPPHQWWQRFAELLVKQNASAQKPQRPFHDTWADGASGEVVYDGYLSQGRN